MNNYIVGYIYEHSCLELIHVIAGSKNDAIIVVMRLKGWGTCRAPNNGATDEQVQTLLNECGVGIAVKHVTGVIA